MSKHERPATNDEGRTATETDDATTNDGTATNRPAPADAATERPTDGDDSGEAAVGEPTAGESAADDDEPFDPEVEGKREAKRLLRAVDGETARARAETAVARKRAAVERLHRQLNEAEQRRQRISQRVEALEYTVERLADADPDRLVLQRLEGGVSMSVPAGERESVRDDLHERRRRLRRRLDDVEGRIEATRRSLRTDRVALDHLQNHEDLVSDR
ncbi:hypothetical protein [Halomicrococcus gelatinilyticus]|uniref:hypothetical protein n=1 Tax=Halomicrococcus gelatinilyticus TaxID=1702103 RepID=UPI002E13F666